MSSLSHPVNSGGSARAKRWLVRLLLPAAAAAMALLTAALGFWQLDRARQKDTIAASIQAKARMPLLQASDLQDDQQIHRVAQVVGRWRPDTTIFLDNRPMAGRAGFIVLTALDLPDGRTVLVQRGWQPRDIRDRTLTQPVPTPADQAVCVRARVAPPPSRLMDFEGGAQATVRQNVDLKSYAAEFGLPRLLPISLQQLEPALGCTAGDGVDVLEDGLRREWTVVGSSADKNRGYALQWFSLSALVVGLFIWFQWLRPWR
ncbi:MAG: SURF1 family protein, partial [Betaproteobacteria bacterium]|nr:SURF1 family protein [Betaproteobacteria bacterium]